MLLEKIKNHAGKISFFLLNILLASVGVLGLRIKDAENEIVKLKQPREEDIAQAADNCASSAIAAVQGNIAEDRKAKTDSVAGNTGEIRTQKPVTTTKTIPAETRTVTRTETPKKTSAKQTRTS